MTRPTTTAHFAAALLSSAPLAGAAGFDLLQDLSVSGSVEASANAFQQMEGPAPDFEIISEEDVDNDSDSADSFAGFPLSASASASAFSNGPALAEASLNATRTRNGVAVDASASDVGGFFQNSPNISSGAGVGDASFRYDFSVEEAVSWLLVFSEEVLSRQGGGLVDADASLIDVATGDAVLPTLVEEDLFRADPTTTSSGTLLAGTYRLSFEIVSEDPEIGGIEASAAFSVSAVVTGGNATPIPSPAALPAGVALLGGLLARRRR